MRNVDVNVENNEINEINNRKVVFRYQSRISYFIFLAFLQTFNLNQPHTSNHICFIKTLSSVKCTNKNTTHLLYLQKFYTKTKIKMVTKAVND